MNVRRALLISLASLMAASCSEKSEPQSEVRAESQAPKKEQEHEEEPRGDQVGEDCVAFLRSTKVPHETAADCPGCSGEGSEVLAFREMRVERTSCSANRCEITVTLRAVFNPGPGGKISGGLTGWIPQEQRVQYLNGHPPEGDQFYHVKITYKRNGQAWRAIEFDRTDS